METHVADFADILLPMDGSEPPVIVGGHGQPMEHVFPRPARTLVNLLGEVWEIVTNPQALQSTKMWGFDFSKIWPHTELESTGNDKVSRWLQHRFPENPN